MLRLHNVRIPPWTSYETKVSNRKSDPLILERSILRSYIRFFCQTAEARAIIMDALNWLGSFWKFHSARKNPWRELEKMEQRVAQFVAAARASGFALVAVIDAATKVRGEELPETVPV